MRLNTLTGTIERRLLINYRVDPNVAAAILPEPFTPTLVDGYAIAGICLIQLAIGPSWLPGRGSFRSLNGAHRIAATLPDGSDAVFIPRRDTSSRLNALVGGRLFPGHHYRATMSVHDSGDHLAFGLSSADGSIRVTATVAPTSHLPQSSVFDDLDHVSDFFERGSLGYSVRPGRDDLEGLELRTSNWSVLPAHVEKVESTFFDDRTLFPEGSAELDNALVMREIRHTWQAMGQLPIGPRRAERAADVGARAPS